MHMNNWYIVLEPLHEPVELSIISDNDGLSPDQDGGRFNYWGEGSEVILEDYLRILPDIAHCLIKGKRDGCWENIWAPSWLDRGRSIPREALPVARSTRIQVPND
jgi:hypothetical protein